MHESDSVIIKDRAKDWYKFLSSKYKAELQEISREFPYKRSIYIDYKKLEKSGEIGLELADEVIKKPGKVIDDIIDSLTEYNLIFLGDKRGLNKEINIRFINITGKKTGIRQLNKKKINTLVSFDAVVKKVSLIQEHSTKVVFKCLQCGTYTPPYTQGFGKWVPPYNNCVQCQKPTKMEIVPAKSTFVDVQRMRVQDPPELVKGGQEPAIIDLDVRDDLCELNIAPGRRVIVNGILKTIQIVKSGSPTPYFEHYIDVISFEFLDSDYDDIIISEEEEQDILKISNSTTIVADMINSLAPAIYGHEDIKLAVLLQLFGGITKENENGYKRGEVHVLVISDPGMGKSDIGDNVCKLAIRGVKTSGRGSSGAGITASVVKDETFGGNNGWTVEAGAMVLADGSIIVCDEGDKMRPEDRGMMHGAMEQGYININKAGLNLRLPSRTAVLMLANPKFGRFDSSAPIASQINLDPALLSRFDLIFPMTDVPNLELDDKVAKRILDTHWEGEHNAAGKNYDALAIKGTIDSEILRKYIAYSKKIYPVLTPEAYKLLNEYYVSIRQWNGESETVPVTARQLEGPIRLAEAYARMHLSETITAEHVKKIKSLAENCLRNLILDKTTGKYDIDRLASQVSSSEREAAKVIRNLLDGCSNSACSVNTLFTTLKIDGFNEDTIQSAIKFLVGEGEIHRKSGMIIKGGYFDE